MIKLISVINKIKDQKLTLSVAESCTGGKIASSIVSYEGASDFFLGGIISYSVDSKIRILNIDNHLFVYLLYFLSILYSSTK